MFYQGNRINSEAGIETTSYLFWVWLDAIALDVLRVAFACLVFTRGGYFSSA
jgi:hypothetical protein